MPGLQLSSALGRKFFAVLTAITLLSPATPAVSSITYRPISLPSVPVRGPIFLVLTLPLQAAMPAAGQQITLAENGTPIASADVALVLANMNKVSLGKTDAQGKTNPALDPANRGDANSALSLANLGKVELHAEVDECGNGTRQVYLVGPGGKLPPPTQDCKRHSLAGTFIWGATTDVVLDLLQGTLQAKGVPVATRQPAAQQAARQPAAQPAGQPAGQQQPQQQAQRPAANP